MSSQTASQYALVPIHFHPIELEKGLDCAANLLTRHAPKRKNPELQPDTIFKILDILAVQMVANTSDAGAQSILDCCQALILRYTQEMLAKPDPVAAMQKVAEVLSSGSAGSVFSVAPATVSAHLDRFQVAEAVAVLREQVEAIQAKLLALGQWPVEFMITADPTDTVYRGRYHNQCTNWGRVGNQPTYKRVFKEFGIFASPLGLQLGFAPLPVNGKGQQELPAWVRNIGFAVAWLSETGTRVPLVAVDREFYSAVGFGAFYFGLLVPDMAAEAQPRLLCPTKLYHSKRDRKWEFLTSVNSAAVTEDSIEISKKDAALFGSAAERLAPGEKGKLLVPVAVVAAFDTYSKKKEPQSLEWARAEAAKVAKQLQAAQSAQSASDKAYKDYTRVTLGKERVPPGGKGKRREKFAGGDEEAQRYWACVAAREAVAKWEAKKAKLCKRLVFFTASLREGEHVVGQEAKFIDLVRHYREHWCIENGFKSQKWQFRVRTNSRKTTARHVRAILGAMFYNAWHYHRILEATQTARESDPEWKSFDTSSPPLRKKFERDFRPALSARGYLLQELQQSMQISIRNFLGKIL